MQEGDRHNGQRMNYTALLHYFSAYLWSIYFAQTNLAKFKGFLIKIKVIKGFSANLKVLKDCNQIKGL